jgi:hypothetical protein
VTVSLVACLAAGCQQESSSALPGKGQIGYRFYSSLDSVADSTSRRDEISQGLVELFQRLGKDSKVHAAWSAWPDEGVQRSICAALDLQSDVTFHVILDPTVYLASQLDSLPVAKHPQVVLENRDKPRTGILNPHAASGAMRTNMVLFQNLTPQGPDDGAFNIYACDAAFPSKSQPGITEAIRIYGDSTLFERCMAYWDGMRESKSEFTFAKTHTYSNLHDHQAWFFPDILAAQPENANSILVQLQQAMGETHQPAKVRLVLTGADMCHLDFFHRLFFLYLEQEADIRVILKDTATIARQVVKVLEQLPHGGLRIFPARDSSHRYELASRFLLIDGPYVTTENEPAQPRRMCFFMGDDLNLNHQRSNSAMWLRIADKRVFSEAEAHWNKLWQMAGNNAESARKIVRQRNCKLEN